VFVPVGRALSSTGLGIAPPPDRLHSASGKGPSALTISIPTSAASNTD
jgi:hypothetical protein